MRPSSLALPATSKRGAGPAPRLNSRQTGTFFRHVRGLYSDIGSVTQLQNRFRTTWLADFSAE
jgi:hypothetical protein